MATESLPIRLAESGWIPTAILRDGIRRVVASRLSTERARARPLSDWIAEMDVSPIALDVSAANEQHYEVPSRFFELVLGPHLKYSSGYWPEGVETLARSEQAMLDLTIEHAGLADHQHILELGCGWGSLTLAMARRFPRARIQAVSNSRRQRALIEHRARQQGLGNIAIATADMNVFDSTDRFDRVVSVEMFEHMRNWRALLQRVHRWLHADGALFVHVFAHQRYAYPYADEASADWMARHFFTGGMMPSLDLLPTVSAPLFSLDQQWDISGLHYARTADAWHDALTRHRAAVLDVLAHHPDGASRAYERWRLFFLACAELFRFREGREWLVAHYRLSPHTGGRA